MGLNNRWVSALIPLVPQVAKSRSEDRHEVVEKEDTPWGLQGQLAQQISFGALQSVCI